MAATLGSGQVLRFKPTFMSTKKFSNVGTLQIYRLDGIEPPGLDADFAVTAFGEGGKIYVNVELQPSSIKFKTMTRCNNLNEIKEAVADYYKKSIARLPVD
jgi:hypothetical protein